MRVDVGRVETMPTIDRGPGQALVDARSDRALGDTSGPTNRQGSRLLSVAAGGLGIAGLVAWEVACAVLRPQPWLLPAPSAIAEAMVVGAPLIAGHAVVTIEETLLGMLVSIALGIQLGVAIVRSRTLERALYPYVIASQTVPVIAIAPLLLIWLGYGIEPKVIVVTLVCFFPIVVNLVDGLRAVDPDYGRLLRTMGASPRQVLTVVEIPAALPYLLSGIKVAASVSVIGAVIGEWVGAQSGLGYLMIRSASQFQTARVFAVIVVLALIGLGLFGLVALAERRLLSYRYGPRRARR